MQHNSDKLSATEDFNSAPRYYFDTRRAPFMARDPVLSIETQTTLVGMFLGLTT